MRATRFLRVPNPSSHTADTTTSQALDDTASAHAVVTASSSPVQFTTGPFGRGRAAIVAPSVNAATTITARTPTRA